jgi:hypothetical protein
MLNSELEPGAEYHFELEVKDARGPTGTNISRKTLLFTNDLPKCTSFTKSPKSGTATDTYTLSVLMMWTKY